MQFIEAVCNKTKVRVGACGGKRGERTSEEVNEGKRLVLLNEHLIKVSYELKSYLGVVRAFIRE